ncbi:MAG TPA: enoyl-CoA hydratase-related protein [Candidatus Binataceae bacterium]|nr:enoyl-CoA hydratase-related protein [Candidatus Binataceae bacterium]
MEFKKILYDKSDRVAKVTLNRPQYRNAQSRVLLEEMDRAFADADADDDIRVIILAGAGDHFSSGHDLGTPEEKADWEARPFGKGVRGEYKRSRYMFLDNTLRWRNLSKPTIAQVQGFCIFGGWMFAAAMDLIVAADDAKFLPSLLQYFSVPYDIPVRKAKEILFQSRFVDANEACELGFVNIVVPRAQLEAETTALATRIAESDRMTLRMLKWAINSAQDEMGYSNFVRNAHSHHMVLGLSGYMQAKLEGKGLPKRMAGVEQALKKGGKDG